jgi:hypothetical protein
LEFDKKAAVIPASPMNRFVHLATTIDRNSICSLFVVLTILDFGCLDAVNRHAILFLSVFASNNIDLVFLD